MRTPHLRLTTLLIIGLATFALPDASRAFNVIDGEVIEFQGADDLFLEPAQAVIAVTAFGQDDAGTPRDLVVNGVTSTALRLAPPLVIGDAEIAEAVAILGPILDELQG